MAMANVLLCSDEPILAEGLSRILSGSDQMRLISYCPGIDGLRDQMSTHQPDILLNLSNDGWFHGSSEHDMHLAVSIFRAVENRVPLARAVNTGISALIDGNGRVLASLPKLKEGILARNIPLDDRVSLYSTWGDWVGILCLAATVALFPLAGLQPLWERTRLNQDL